jgi:hypothetical protein
MGLKDLRKRLTASVRELDDQRLQERFHGLDITAMGEVTCRTPVRVGGEITRMRTLPRSGVPSFEITVSDGTGSATAVFTGRRQLGGVEHARAIVLEGVAHEEHGKPVLLNPAYTLLPDPHH